jgi:hypothetical protein
VWPGVKDGITHNQRENKSRFGVDFLGNNFFRKVTRWVVATYAASGIVHKLRKQLPTVLWNRIEGIIALKSSICTRS